MNTHDNLASMASVAPREPMWFLPEGQLPESPEKDGDQPDGIEAAPAVPVRRRIQFWLNR